MDERSAGDPSTLDAGSVFIDSRNDIDVNGEISSSPHTGNAGDVSLLAGENITLNDSILSYLTVA